MFCLLRAARCRRLRSRLSSRTTEGVTRRSPSSWTRPTTCSSSGDRVEVGREMGLGKVTEFQPFLSQKLSSRTFPPFIHSFYLVFHLPSCLFLFCSFISIFIYVISFFLLYLFIHLYSFYLYIFNFHSVPLFVYSSMEFLSFFNYLLIYILSIFSFFISIFFLIPFYFHSVSILSFFLSFFQCFPVFFPSFSRSFSFTFFFAPPFLSFARPFPCMLLNLSCIVTNMPLACLPDLGGDA